MGKIQSNAARTLFLVGTTFLSFETATAQDSDGTPATTKEGAQVQANLGSDTTNEYFFRGIQQETQGVIAQPWVDFVFPLWEGDNTAWSLNIGAWSSLHDGSTGSGGAGMSIYYETDAYAGIGFDFAEKWSSSLKYIVLSSPNSAFATVQELDLSVSFDDSGLFGGGSSVFFGVQPSATIAWELDGQSDGGSDEGLYFEVGIEPPFEILDDENLSISASLPIAAGFSLSDYFEDATGNDDFYGFTQLGAMLSTTLNFLPARMGSWSLNGGVHFLLLGDNLKMINGGDSSEVIFNGSLGITF